MPDITIKKLNYLIRNDKLENHILNNVNISFLSSEISVILGPSGSGKTSLFRCIAGLENSYSGDIYFNGENINNVPTKDRNISYVPQSFNMYPHMTLFDNIAYPLKLLGAKKNEIIDRVYTLTDKFGISEILSRKPKQVSLGELQRACLVRALIKRPDICLLDEPFSNLDNENRSNIRRLCKTIFKELGCTVIISTHSINDATSLADHVYILEKGKFIYSASPKEIIFDKSPLIEKYFIEDKENDLY